MSKNVSEKELSMSKNVSEKELSMSKNVNEKELSVNKNVNEKELSINKNEKDLPMSKKVIEKELLSAMSQKLLSTLGTETYHYVAVKGSPYSLDSHVFGLSDEETVALLSRYPESGLNIINGIMLKGAPFSVINSLAELGYRVICSTGDHEVLWTLQREL